MKFHKCFRHAANMVMHSQLRSWLTIIGIVIGVASVIAIVSLGNNMEDTMNDQLGGLGTDLLTITAGYSRGGSMFGGGGPPGMGGGATATEDDPELTKLDVQILKAIPDLSIVSPTISGSVEVSYLGKSGTVSLTGVDQKVWSQITTEEIAEGRMLDSADQNVIVIGGRLAEDYFSQPLGLNKMLTIEDSAYRIVGILDDTSTSVYMPITMAYQVIEDAEIGVYDKITVKIKDEGYLNETIETVEKKLRNSRHVSESEQDFTVSSSAQMQETREEMMGSMTTFLAAIAAVSLIVGAVGVANSMFTSVIEKTKEIGIMKAIGAKNRDIMLLFVLNAGIIGLVGGILGAILGAILSGMLPALMGDVGMFSGGSVTLDTVLLALGISVSVGIVSGLVPAYQGSKLKPVDALRYE